MVKNQKEQHITDMVEAVIVVIILIALVGFAFLPLIEQTVLGAYNEANGTTQMLIGAVPVFAVIALIGIILRKNRMGLM